MRIAVAATPIVALPTLEALFASSHEISIVITQPDSKQGRGRELAETVVAQWAASKAIQVVKAESDSDVKSALVGADLLIAIGFGRILSEETLNTPKFGSINLHFSLLPAYRGAAPAQRALLSGDSSTGVTVFALDKGLDTGPIYTQIMSPIDPQWTGLDLLTHLSEIGAEATMNAIKMIGDGKTPTPQNNELATYAPKILREEREIIWSKSAKEISLQIRAFAPSVATQFRGENFKISLAFPTSSSGQLTPGEILLRDKDLLVGTGDGVLHILEVVPAGKKVMSAYSWANGARLSTGEKFE